MEAPAHTTEAKFKVPGLVATLAPRKVVKPKQADDGIGEAEVSTTDDTPVEEDKTEPDRNNKSSASAPSSESSFDEKKKTQHVSGKRVELKLNYQEPPGAMPFDSRYSLEVLKTGLIVDRVKFSKDKTFFVVGRTPACDVVAENPTVSRMHAIIQFVGGTNAQSEEKSDPDDRPVDCKERGLYLYDLNSTHGTFLNKNQVYPNRFYRLRVGHMIKFGNSTRQYIVDGPSEDQEEESDKTVTELLQERLEKEFIRKKLMAAATPEEEEQVEDTGINWGMGEDAVEETDYNVNPFSLDFESSDLNLDNPKKTLAGWFEREGYDNLFYDVREKASGHFICRVNLPVDGPNGAPVFAEVDLKGKKKEVVVQCALKACQILDKYGVLRQSHHEGYKKKLKDWEEKDYYSSDEDTFLDRTGSIETKRTRRMKQSGKDVGKAESFDTLNEKYNALEEEIQKLEQSIQKAVIKQEKEDDEVDPLEAFMQTVKSGALDIKQMKFKLKQLKEEQLHVKKLIEIARPANLPSSLLAKPNTDTGKRLSMKKEEVKKSEPAAKSEDKISSEPMETAKPENVDKVPSGQEKLPEVRQPVEQPASDKPDEAEAERNPNRKRIATKFSHVSSALPFANNEENPDPDDEMRVDDDHSASSKKKRKRNRAQFKKEEKLQYDADNPDYSVWVPPTDQAGDGKTKLNEKLGY